MSPTRAFAVVVNWNGGEANLDCLASLVDEGFEPERIVFVDNGSSDGSRELVRARFPRLAFVDNATNLGFGEGANQGARLALERGAERVFFVNNDLLLAPGCFALLEAALEECEQRGVVGPRVLDLDEPSRVWCAGGLMTWRQNLSTLRGHGEPDGAEYRLRMEVDYIPGCAMLVKRAVLEEIGLLDADLFAYMEDVDFCLRAKAAGFEVFLVGDAAAHHASSSATGGGYNPRRKYMMGVNSIWFLRRHGRARHWLRFALFDVASLPALWLAGLASGRSRAVLAKGLGIWDGLRGKRVTAERIQPGASRLW